MQRLAALVVAASITILTLGACAHDMSSDEMMKKEETMKKEQMMKKDDMLKK